MSRITTDESVSMGTATEGEVRSELPSIKATKDEIPSMEKGADLAKAIKTDTEAAMKEFDVELVPLRTNRRKRSHHA